MSSRADRWIRWSIALTAAMSVLSLGGYFAYLAAHNDKNDDVGSPNGDAPLVARQVAFAWQDSTHHVWYQSFVLKNRSSRPVTIESVDLRSGNASVAFTSRGIGLSPRSIDNPDALHGGVELSPIEGTAILPSTDLESARLPLQQLVVEFAVISTDRLCEDAFDLNFTDADGVQWSLGFNEDARDEVAGQPMCG